jgi:phage terminase large subunit-like protein
MIPEVPDPTGRGERAWQILSRLPIVEGTFAGKRIGDHSPPWQRRLTRLIFGFTGSDGLRILREIFACMSKKNGKSDFASNLALTKLLLNEEVGEQIVCLAATRTQSHIMFDGIAKKVRADPELAKRFRVVDYRHTITYAATNSKITALSAELAATVGLNPSLALVDELHLLGATPKGQQLVSQLRTGAIARREPLMFSISTAPADRSQGIFESTYQKAKRVISGAEIDPRFFGWICEVSAGLDPEDPNNWHWSNPSLGYTVTVERLMAELESARTDPASLRDFRSQNLNVSPDESAGVNRWLSMVEWDQAADNTLNLEALLEEAFAIYVGIDRGGLDDLSALCVLGKTLNGEILAWSHQWLHRRGYEKRKKVNDYDGFVAAGELTLFEDGSQDLTDMAEVVRQVAATGKLSLAGIDSFCAPDTAAALIDLGVEVESVPQGWKLTSVITWFERLLADGTFKHTGSRLLRWNVSNAVCTRRGNAVEISKASAVGAGKIDGLAALFDAGAACISRADKDEPSVYEFHGLRTV